MARNARITMMVPQELKDDLQTLAKSMYHTESSLCTYIVSQWMYAQKQVNDKLLDTLNPNNLHDMVKRIEGSQCDEGETK